jgi:hemolysin activation/secretion protein
VHAVCWTHFEILKTLLKAPPQRWCFDRACLRLKQGAAARWWAGLALLAAQLLAPPAALGQGIPPGTPASTNPSPNTAADAATTARFTVKSFRIDGVTLVSQASLQAALAPWLNKPITVLHLQHAARTMAEVYRTEGWPMRPQVPTQEVVNGEVRFSVVETRLLDAAKTLQHLAELAQAARLRAARPAPEPGAMAAKLLAALTPPDGGGFLRETRRPSGHHIPDPRDPRDPRNPVPGLVTSPGSLGHSADNDVSNNVSNNVSNSARNSAGGSGATEDKGPSFTVKGFRLNGVTLVNEAALQMALSALLNRPIVFVELQAATQIVADVYRSQGWLARTQLPTQDLVGGVVTLNVVEARLGEVRVDDLGMAMRFDKGRLLATVQSRQQANQPLNLHDVERAVQVLNNTPGLRAEAVLAPGREPGQTDVVVRAVDQPLFSGQAHIDNQGARSAGAARVSANLVLRDTSGHGDETLLSGQSTGWGNVTASLAASLPLGHDGWRLALNASALQYRLVGDFAAAQSQGSARTVGLQLRYPLGRSVVMGLGIERRSFINQANGDEISNKRLQGFTASFSGDGSALWPQDQGLTQWSVSAWVGAVDLSANAAHAEADAAGPRAAGRYGRVAYSLSRLQPVAQASSLYFGLTGQVASKNLDSADKFSLGGVNGVRAYPGLEAGGDSGWLANIEWRQTLLAGLQTSAFYDHGQVQLNQRADFSGAALVNRISLKGVGLGVNWSPGPRYSLRLQVARRVGANPLANALTGFDTDGSYSLYRAWLGLSYLF